MVLRASRFVFRVAYAVLLNAHDAEDAVQETFLKLYRNGGWRGMENERAFLARTAWRVAQDSRRHLAGFRERETGAEGRVDMDAEHASLLPNPEEATMDHDRERRIHVMIDALPEDLRLPLVLSSLEEMNSREIGGILSIPEGTVRTRIQRARQMLREKLAAQEARSREVRHAR